MTGGEPFAERFESLAPSLAGAGVAWLAALRRNGLNSYRSAGLPSRKVEAWKYTNLHPLTEASFLPAAAAPEIMVDAIPQGVLGARTGAMMEGATAVFVNGGFRPALSRLDGLPEGVLVASLAAEIERDAGALEAHLGRVLTLDGMPLAALNAAFLGDGLVIRVAQGARIEEPLHLISIGAAAREPLAFYPRHLIVLEAGASATVIESHIGLNGTPYFSNSVVEAVIGAGASLRHYKLQNEASGAFHLATTALDLADRAAYEGFVLHIGGRIARNETRAHLAGPGADFRLDGAYLAGGEGVVDNTTFIDHARPQGRSRQTFRGVLNDSARGVFQGKILVRPGAGGTDGHQLSQALLLSRKAEMDGKPELEIYADDVKCGHGATVGEIAGEALFYLRCRGIDEASARRMLIEAFLAEVVEGVTNEAVREALLDAVRGRLDSGNGAIA
jgi:Fe-S cluster assembly protein SufD